MVFADTACSVPGACAGGYEQNAAEKVVTKVTSKVVAIPTPADIVDAFHEALRTRDLDRVVALMAADASLFETGFVESSRDDYVKNHLNDDADFAKATDYKLIRRSVITEGQTAWVLTQAAISGIFGDQRVALEQTETMILRRTKTSWEIMHLHWSAHPQQADAKSSAELTVPAQSEAKPEDIKKP